MTETQELLAAYLAAKCEVEIPEETSESLDSGDASEDPLR